jgi:hypothetical protein
MKRARNGLLRIVHERQLPGIGRVPPAHVRKSSIEVWSTGGQSFLARRPHECQEQDAADTKEVDVE